MNWWIVAACVAIAVLLVNSWRFSQLRRRYWGLELDTRLATSRVRQLQSEVEAINAINRGFVQEAPAAMFLVTPQGKVRYYNTYARDLFHLPPLMDDERPLVELVHDHDLDRMMDRILSRELLADTVEITPPGTNLTLQADARAICTGQGDLLGAALLLENLTGLRRMEAARRDLVANVSHELRTPLAGMKALVETLESGVDDEDLAASFLHKMHGEIDRLALLVHDLLELSRIESGGILLTCEPVALAEIVATTLDRLHNDADSVGIRLENAGGEPVWVVADGNRCEQVLMNLIQNALKFTPAGGTVAVSWKADGGQCAVHVRDTGIGIAPEEQPRIFERFYKVDKGRAGHTGTGLGLAIVKHLTTMMGGGVGVQSQPGAGSDFFFTLPLTQGPAAAAQTTAAA